MSAKRTRRSAVLVVLMMVFSMLHTFALDFPLIEVPIGDPQITQSAGLFDVSELPDIAAGLTGAAAYQVRDRAGYLRLAELAAAGNTFAGITVYQSADIDLGWEPVSPIGYWSAATSAGAPFSGTFDGNGFVIENLYLPLGSHAGVGMFGYAKNAVFKNVGISSGLIAGYNTVGGIVGRGESILLQNCWNAATVFGARSDGTGGLAGRASGQSSFYNSYNLGLVFNRLNHLGGLCGWMNGAADGCNMVNCYNYGTLLTGYAADSSLSSELHGYNALVRLDANTNRLTASNNYYRTGCYQHSLHTAIVNGVKISGNAPATDDAGTGISISGFGSLAAQLNGGAISPNAAAGVSGYTVSFTNGPDGYPVITYLKNNQPAVRRLSNASFNVGASTWARKSALFSRVQAAAVQSGGTGANTHGAFQLASGELTVSSADDLFLLGLLTMGVSASSTGITSLKFGADINMTDCTLAPVKAFLPLCSRAQFDAPVQGGRHVIRNWGTVTFTGDYDACGGLFPYLSASLTGLGLINARSGLQYFFKTNSTEQYPSLLAGVAGGDGSVQITDCFATGTLEISYINYTGAQHEGALLSRLLDPLGQRLVENCWANASVVHAHNGNLTRKMRAVGSADDQNDSAEERLANVVYCASEAIAGNGSADPYQQVVDAGSARELAWKLNASFAPEGIYWTVNGADEVIWGTAANAAYALRVEAGTRAETIYALPGETITLPTYTGYQAPGGATTYTMTAEDNTLVYQALQSGRGELLQLAEDLADLDPALFAQDLAALKSEIAAELNKQSAVTQAVVNAFRARAEALTLKNSYPAFPRATEAELYAPYAPQGYLIYNSADWLALVSQATKFSGISLHLMADIDMAGAAMRPLAESGGFYGLLDGHDFSFYNVNIVGSGNMGLIASVWNGGVVQNLGVASGAVVNNTTGESYGTGGIAGLLANGAVVRRCWNGASVTSAGGADNSVAGIVGRGLNGSLVDNCYNIGAVTGANHASALNDWGQATGYVFNSFNAGTITAQENTQLSRNSAAVTAETFSNLYTITPLKQLVFDLAVPASAAVALDEEDYANGRLAYLLNTSYAEGKGTQPYYAVRNGETVFGTEQVHTRKVTVFMEGQDAVNYYWNSGDVHTLNLGPNITYEVESGDDSALDGNVLTVPNSDILILAVEHPCSHDWAYTSLGDGTHRRVCSICGDEEVEYCELIDETVPPAVGVQGYTLHTCVLCDYSYRDHYVPALPKRTIVMQGGGAAPGETVQVALALNGNEDGLGGMTLALSYDTAALTYQSVESTYFRASGAGNALTLIADQDVCSADGEVLALLNFRVNKSAADGDYTVRAAVSNAYSAEEGNFPVNPGEATVTVSSGVWGDVDGNDVCELEDAVLMLKYLAQLIDASQLNLTAADTNGDGDVTLEDAVLMLQVLAGLTTQPNV